MRRYETIFITHADLPEEDINDLVVRYSAIITDRQGTVIKIEKWGKRKLAYEINKQYRGFYVLLDFAGSSAIVTELERNLRISDQILKYMTVKTQDMVNLQDLEKEMAPSVAEEKIEPISAPDQVTADIPESFEATEAGPVATGEGEAPISGSERKEEVE